MSQPTHDILLAENYEAADGAEKAYFTNIGSAWLKDSGVISCEIRPGLSISGNFVILPRKEKSE